MAFDKEKMHEANLRGNDPDEVYAYYQMYVDRERRNQPKQGKTFADFLGWIIGGGFALLYVILACVTVK